MSQSMLDIIKAQLDRMERLQKQDHEILLEVQQATAEILDAVTVDQAVNLGLKVGPVEEQP